MVNSVVFRVVLRYDTLLFTGHIDKSMTCSFLHGSSHSYGERVGRGHR